MTGCHGKHPAHTQNKETNLRAEYPLALAVLSGVGASFAPQTLCRLVLIIFADVGRLFRLAGFLCRCSRAQCGRLGPNLGVLLTPAPGIGPVRLGRATPAGRGESLGNLATVSVSACFVGDDEKTKQIESERGMLGFVHFSSHASNLRCRD